MAEVRRQMSGAHYSEAAAAATARLAELQSLGHVDGPEAAELTALLAEATYRQGGNWRDALPLAEEALAMQERSWGRQDVRLADTLVMLSALTRIGDDPAAALAFAERALAIRERALGPGHLDVASSLNELAIAALRLSDYSLALHAFERALPILESHLGPRHPEVGMLVSNLGHAQLELGDREAARAHFGRAGDILEGNLPAGHPALIRLLGGRAMLARQEADFGAARGLLERIAAAWEQAGRQRDLAATITLIGDLQYDIGEYADARRSYEETVRLHSEVDGPRHRAVAVALTNLGLVVAELGDFEAAESHYQEALGIYRRYDEPGEGYALTLDNLGSLLLRTGELEEAAKVLAEALAILEPIYEAPHERVAQVAANLGTAALRQGKLAAAEAHLRRSLEIRETIDPHHRAIALSLRPLAAVWLARGQPSRAVPLLLKALAVDRESLGEEHPLVAAVLAELATAQRAAGDASNALANALEAEAKGREHLRATARRIDERTATGYASARPSGLDLASSHTAEGQPPSATARVWDGVIRSRAVVLEEVVSRRAAISSTADPEIHRLADRLEDASRKLSKLAVASLAAGASGELDSEEMKGWLDRARGDKEEIESDLASWSAAYRRSRDRAQLGLAEVGSALPPKSVLVAYQRYLHHSETPGRASTPSYLAWVLDRERQVHAVRLGRAEAIDSAIESWRREAGVGPPLLKLQRRQAEARCRTAGEAVRRLVWDPVAPQLQDAEQLFIVPDGALHRVSFAALPAAEGGYLVEAGPLLHLLTAERDLVVEPSSRGEGLLLVSAPDFQASPAPTVVAAAGTPSGAEGPEVVFRGAHASCKEFSELRFDALPAALTEAREISDLWRRQNGSPVLELSGQAALETAFKRNASGRRVLHLATHGFVLRDACAEAGDEDPPLLLAGLGLAGANRRGDAAEGEDDGILTAEEVATLDLSGVEWAVLSGCDTGLGDIVSGEGVVGLRRAFHAAGARTVIMSLWPVADEAASRFMRELYAARLAGASTAEAVHRATVAQLAARRRSQGSSHPFEWGAWVAAGDWR